MPRVADFIHGSDGLGNIYLPPPKSKKCDKSASEFLVEKVLEYPGEVSILALGPLTNLALVRFWFICLCLCFQFYLQHFNCSSTLKLIPKVFMKSGYQKGLFLC